MKGQRIGMIAAFILLSILLLAWYDGGEEAMRPIEQTIPLPEGAR